MPGRIPDESSPRDDSGAMGTTSAPIRRQATIRARWAVGATPCAAWACAPTTTCSTSRSADADNCWRRAVAGTAGRLAGRRRAFAIRTRRIESIRPVLIARLSHREPAATRIRALACHATRPEPQERAGARDSAIRKRRIGSICCVLIAAAVGAGVPASAARGLVSARTVSPSDRRASQSWAV